MLCTQRCPGAAQVVICKSSFALDNTTIRSLMTSPREYSKTMRRPIRPRSPRLLPSHLSPFQPSFLPSASTYTFLPLPLKFQTSLSPGVSPCGVFPFLNHALYMLSTASRSCFSWFGQRYTPVTFVRGRGQIMGQVRWAQGV
jgi:hypothetical protein